MIVNKNSNQSQALKLVRLHVLPLFTFSLFTRAGKCAICVCSYFRFAKTFAVKLWQSYDRRFV